jgi:hypothetical protein
MVITNKATSLFAMLKEKAGLEYDVEFSANFGWFKRFKNRYSLHTVIVSGETASTDVNKAEDVLENLYKLIVEENYV